MSKLDDLKIRMIEQSSAFRELLASMGETLK